MNSAALFLVIMFTYSCNQTTHQTRNTKQSDTSFINDIKRHFSNYYSLFKRDKYNVSNKDSVRAEQFFSNGLRKADFYIYHGKRTDSIHSATAKLVITIYEYSLSDTAVRVINDFEKEKLRIFEEREYGPLGKDYQFFLQTSNYVIHLEADCQSSQEKEWFNVEDLLTKIAELHFGRKYLVITKTCQ